MARRKQAPKKDQLAPVRKEVLSLYLGGYSIAEIAERTGYGTTAVSRRLREALLAQEAEKNGLSEYQRTVDLARVDMVLQDMLPRATSGDTDAVAAVDRLLKRRAAMLGYDMPTKIERTDEPPPPLAIYVAGPGGELLPLDDFQQALSPGGDDGDQ